MPNVRRNCFNNEIRKYNNYSGFDAKKTCFYLQSFSEDILKDQRKKFEESEIKIFEHSKK